MKGEHARESLLQKVGLAYLWDQDTLDGPRIAYLFEAGRVEDLRELARYFSMIRGEPLTPEQKEKIFLFTDRCLAWSKTLDSTPAVLLSQLSLLSSYLTTINDRALAWLLVVAPHTPVNYNAERLIEDLARLAGASPANTGHILRVLLEAYEPSFDYEDRLKKLILELAAHPESRPEAILCIERVRHLPGMVQLYGQLFSTTPSTTA
jgi:hypothetical protein